MRYKSDLAGFPLVDTFLEHEIRVSPEGNFYAYIQGSVETSVNIKALKKKISDVAKKIVVVEVEERPGYIRHVEAIRFEADGRLRTVDGLYYISRHDFFLPNAELLKQFQALREELDEFTSTIELRWTALRDQLTPVTPENLKEIQSGKINTGKTTNGEPGKL